MDKDTGDTAALLGDIKEILQKLADEKERSKIDCYQQLSIRSISNGWVISYPSDDDCPGYDEAIISPLSMHNTKESCQGYKEMAEAVLTYFGYFYSKHSTHYIDISVKDARKNDEC